MDNYNQDFYADISGGVIFFIFAIIFIIIMICSFISFKNERDYIKMEIERSTKKEELKFWKEELKRFYLRKIPIFGMFFWDDTEYEDYDE